MFSLSGKCMQMVILKLNNYDLALGVSYSSLSFIAKFKLLTLTKAYLGRG